VGPGSEPGWPPNGLWCILS